MRRSFILLLLLVCTLTVSAQQSTEETQRVLKYVQNAMLYNKAVPQEKVYMHFDNTGYFENETIWFKAYITRTSLPIGPSRSDVVPTDLSKVLYVELLNPSGDIIKSHKLPIDSLGQAYGDLKLDSLYGSGFYEVRAYTRYMTNWGVNAVFSRVFPVFKAPKAEGDYSDLTLSTRLYKDRNPNNRDQSDSLYTKAIEAGLYSSNNLAKTVSVRFYPEGGDLVVGKKSRVAVLAVDDNGRPYQGEGFVTDSQGQVLANVKTDSLGKGLFTIIPPAGQLNLQIRNLKDREQRIPLPAAKNEGCTLTLDAVSDEMLVTLQSTDGVCGRLLGYTIVNNGNVTYCDTVVASPLIEIELDRANLKQGVNQFTVFNSDGQILAERLFFIYPEPDPADSIRLVSRTPRLKPCGLIELDVNARPNTTFSFSAIDAVTMTNGKQGNIRTWMLLGSEVRGYIDNIDYYFESDDADHRRAADLLMLTQGWRRYDWTMMAGLKTFDKIQPIEDKFYVYGQLGEYRKKNKVAGVGLEAFLYNRSGESLVGRTTSDADGNYAFELPFVDGEWAMQIFTKVDDKRKTYRVGIDRQFSPTPRYITPVESQLRPPLAPNLLALRENENLEEDEFIPITRKDIVLQNVTVKAKRRYFTNDDWRWKNENVGREYASVYYDIDRELENLLDDGEKVPTIFEFLVRRNALCNEGKYQDLPRLGGDTLSGHYEQWYGRFSYGGLPIKWFVDNGETHLSKPEGYHSKLLPPDDVEDDLDDNYCAVTTAAGAEGDAFFPLFMDEIKSLYIVPSSPQERLQCVRIYIYAHHRYGTESNKGLRKTYFQGFNKPSTFQMEDYSVIPPMADFRRTIYWNPNVTTDAEGKAHISFYNNSTSTGIYATAEGISNDGHVQMFR